MSMKRLTVKNFRGIESLTLNLAQLNVITAPNGSGKSSFIDAVYWLISGDVSDDDIRHGEKTASVEVEFESGTILARQREEKSGKAFANGKEVTAKVMEEMLTNEFNCSLDTAKAVCGTDYLDGLSQKDLTAFLLKILPITVKNESVISLTEEALGRKLLPDENTFIKSYLNEQIYKLDDFTKIHDEAFAQRRLRKKDFEEAKNKGIFDTTTLPQESKEQLQKELEQIALKEATLNDFNKKMTEYNNAVENHKKVTSRKAEIIKALEEYKDVEKPVADSERIKNERQQFLNAIEKGMGELTLSQNKLTELVDAYKSLENPVCPLTKMNCSADLTSFKDNIGEQGKKIASAINEKKEFLSKCRAQVELRNKLLEEYNEKNLLWTKKSSLTNELNNLIMPVLPEKPAEIKAEDITKEKAAINQKLAIYNNFEASKSYSKQAIEIGREVELLDLCVKLFDTKGIKSVLLKKALTPIENLVNKYASAVRPNFKITLLGKDGLDANIYPDGQTPVPINKVSSGEFILTAYLLMGAIHDLTNVPFFVIDDMDRLDKENAQGFMKLIKADKRFKNVILAGVNHEDFTTAIPSDATVINL